MGVSDLGSMRDDFLESIQQLRIKNDPVEAFKQITGKEPYEYQTDYLRNQRPFNVVNKSRQTGYTYVTAFLRFWRLWTKRSESEIIVSVSQRASDTVMRYIKGFFREVGINHKTAARWSNDLVELRDGRTIFSLPQNPSTIRSLHGNVLLDEAAHFERGREIAEAVLPFISRGFAIDVVSTPRGKDDFFYNTFWLSERFHHVETPWFECPDLAEEHLEVIWERMDEDSKRQEYFCEFVDEATAYFPYDLIMSRVDSDLVLDNKEVRYVGVDIGRVKDATEVIGLDESGRVRMIETMKGVPFRDQLGFLGTVLERDSVNRVCVDCTGIGMQLAEELYMDYGSKVEEIHFTNEIKETLMTNLRIAFEGRGTGELMLPNERDLINQVHAMKRMPTSTGIRFDVEKNPKHHGDKAWALSLAWHAGFGPVKGAVHLLDNPDLDSVI